MQDVYSHFQERVLSNSSSFTVVNPNQYRDGIQRQFYFKYVHIVPEYFSILATENELENDDLNPILTKHGFIFEFFFHNQFYGEDEKFELSTKIGPLDIVKAVTELNKKVDDSKNAAYTFSPLVIDWVDPKIMTLKTKHAFQTYMQSSAPMYYKTEEDMDGQEVTTFNPETHTNVLPRSCANMDMVNPFHIPNDDVAFLNCRMRLILAPNTRLSLSNSLLLRALGFSEAAFGVRGLKNRYHIVNPHPDKRMIIVADRPPMGPIVEIPNISNLYIMSNEQRVEFQRDMILSKTQELKPVTVAEEVIKLFEQVSKDCYIKFGVTYDQLARRFKFSLSNNAVFESRIRISNYLMPLLGYPGSEFITIQNLVGANITRQQKDLTRYIQLCRILTQDTGHVIITMENVPSILNRGQPEQIVSALVPKDDVLKQVKNVAPKFFVPENGQDLIFKIYRHSEVGRGKMIQLGWPVDCYVYALICGEPIKTTKSL